MAVQDEVPKSRLTLRYKTEVNGKPEDVNLPLRLMVLGDFSLGTSADRKVDLEERRLRNLDGKNTAAVMKDMKIALEISVPNKIDPENSETLDVKLPITSMNSFRPDEIVKNVPKLKGLVLLKRLLQEVEANVSNTKELRKLIADLYASEEAFKKIQEQLKGFEGFRVPGAAPAGAAS